MAPKRDSSKKNTSPIAALEDLCNQLMASENIQKKLEIIKSFSGVKKFLVGSLFLNKALQKTDAETEFVICAVLALGQGPFVFGHIDYHPESLEKFHSLVSTLKDMEKFYDRMGGIIGYHITVLKLIDSTQSPSPTPSHQSFYDEPEGLDISKDSSEGDQVVRWGIESLHELAEIYPLGGAGDRLHLQDEISGEFLPAAQLPFCGRTLLEGMIRDLQGREYLYYKLFGKQIKTPLAIMTSHEKNNHAHILNICHSNHWFGRSKDNFLFFIQSLVPMIAEDGTWAMHDHLQPILKPGGHGVIWKVAFDQGVFQWLERFNCRKALIRQINNPVAGVDNGLFALWGIGCHENKDFGFASCFRLLNQPEGMDVLCEKQVDGEYEYCITNIEYTEFEQRGIKDVPESPNSPYSRFPANTNILFVDLHAIKRVIEQCPLPGVIINMKNIVTCRASDGEMRKIHAGRLESTMQNIADYIVDRFPRRLKKGERGDLSTFITYNERRKTISVTKQAYEPGKPLNGTPEGCYYELMQNYHDVLTNYCHFKLPKQQNEKEYLDLGPTLVIHFHPAFGVLFDVIGQKVQKGILAEGSEWIMEVAEAEITNLHLDGSLLIEADSIMGKPDADGVVNYNSADSGKCILKDVKVVNKGLDRNANNVFWKHQVHRLEALHIILHGNAEFYAENVHLNGNLKFEVPDGHRMHVEQKDGRIVSSCKKIKKPTWQWEYQFNTKNKIILKKISQTI